MSIRLTIRYRTDSIEASVMMTDTLESLKLRIQEITGVPVDSQVLLFNDRVLSDNNKELKELGIESDCTLHLKKKMEVKREGKKPDFTASMMKNPLVKNFLKNPDAMKSIVEMFPGLKEEMNNNPDLRMMMNSSNLQDELEMFSMNPEYMNTQLKNLDITMSKLENIPGGLNMISSMIKDVQDPLSSALKEGMGRGYKVREGRKIDKPINEAIPGNSSRRESQLLKYKDKLAELKQIGFNDTRRNFMALMACNGDLEGSIMYLQELDRKSSPTQRAK
ncbi:hypothetical protein EHEL_101770 [Encephalitozoon hellem ATCC 50504]|uniref:Ubiquitin-like protein n=1 Tax=Encephalitozoon hellem TaxID=27973 RepID=A0A9Q9FAH0_ENCHE|nr:uncharacterized protein EHEL_101770 [Encephalitozoon hellem ATCC 50504]AFM99269.1 hypothetical protein EHEL_101770 [Encephalitozoon hellem ATCC 50504]UTX44257.1 ubiquitin-like protein [Encephalitozoon hellem]WEL39748.1 ubiquitin-like protein [Encephalitozoon hellem]|eukprot:XP_003888250.1 hypothetical protein EHEL_101770 [Encephalitozoon hellem ATCC 50504]